MVGLILYIAVLTYLLNQIPSAWGPSHYTALATVVSAFALIATLICVYRQMKLMGERLDEDRRPAIQFDVRHPMEIARNGTVPCPNLGKVGVHFNNYTHRPVYFWLEWTIQSYSSPNQRVLLRRSMAERFVIHPMESGVCGFKINPNHFNDNLGDDTPRERHWQLRIDSCVTTSDRVTRDAAIRYPTVAWEIFPVFDDNGRVTGFGQPQRIGDPRLTHELE